MAAGIMGTAAMRFKLPPLKRELAPITDTPCRPEAPARTARAHAKFFAANSQFTRDAKNVSTNF